MRAGCGQAESAGHGQAAGRPSAQAAGRPRRTISAGAPESSVRPVPSSLLSTPSKGLMVSREAKRVPGGLTLTEWTCLSVTQGVSGWWGRQYPFPSMSSHSDHDSIRPPLTWPSPEGLLGELPSPPPPAGRGWSMPADNRRSGGPSSPSRLGSEEDKWVCPNRETEAENQGPETHLIGHLESPRTPLLAYRAPQKSGLWGKRRARLIQIKWLGTTDAAAPFYLRPRYRVWKHLLI